MVGLKFFGTPFSERKVCSFAYFSYKKSRFAIDRMGKKSKIKFILVGKV